MPTPEQIQKKRNEAFRSKIVGIASTIVIHAFLFVFAYITFIDKDEAALDKVDIILDFTEPEPVIEEIKPIEAKTGNEPKAKEASPEKEVRLVQKSEAPIQAKSENKGKESIIDEKGDVEQITPKPPKPINKKALFNNRRKKSDTIQASQVAEKISNSLKDGNSEGNTRVGNPEGMASAKLKGRNIMGSLPEPSYEQQAEGKVVVKIRVNQYGEVINAIAGISGTTVQNAILWKAAQKAALGAKFNISENAPTIQEGTITYYFKLK